MGEMSEMVLEEASRQWLAEHLGESEADYQRYLDMKTEEEEDQLRSGKLAIKLILTALQDGNWWIAKGQKKIAIDKISVRHARNIIGWLRRRAGFLHDITCLEFMEITAPTAEAALDYYNDSFNLLNEMDPVEWLMQTPLVVNLKAKIKAAEFEG